MACAARRGKHSVQRSGNSRRGRDAGPRWRLETSGHSATVRREMKRRKNTAAPAASLKIRPATAADRAEWGRMRCTLWPDCSPARGMLEMRELLSDPKKFGILVLDR